MFTSLEELEGTDAATCETGCWTSSINRLNLHRSLLGQFFVPELGRRSCDLQDEEEGEEEEEEEVRTLHLLFPREIPDWMDGEREMGRMEMLSHICLLPQL